MATTPGTAVPGTSVPSGSAVGPGGAQGIQGLPGPIVVSSDAGNIATIGSDNQILVPQSQIWSVRQRTFSSIGNPTFEVDQRNVFTAIANVPNGMVQDRWGISTGGTLRASWQANQGQTIVVPGTSFQISQAQVNIQSTTAEASLAAGSLFAFYQNIEGPVWRELANDVTSISLLVYCSIAGFKFAVSLRNGAQTVSLVKLCTIPSANTWTLITLPNILKPTSGSFPLTPGSNAYVLGVCLGSGTTYIAPSLDVWNAGNFLGAPGMSNLFATTGNTFIIAFVQHEPGVCTTLIDCPFGQNLNACQRYFQKSYDYGTKIGTVNNAVYRSGFIPAGLTTNVTGFGLFERELAKTPTLTTWDPGNGAQMGALNVSAGVHSTVTATTCDTKGIGYLTIGAAAAASQWIGIHYTADTGW